MSTGEKLCDPSRGRFDPELCGFSELIAVTETRSETRWNPEFLAAESVSYLELFKGRCMLIVSIRRLVRGSAMIQKCLFAQACQDKQSNRYRLYKTILQHISHKLVT